MANLFLEARQWVSCSLEKDGPCKPLIVVAVLNEHFFGGSAMPACSRLKPAIRQLTMSRALWKPVAQRLI